jgi:uncharacterized membrane protein YfcA
VSLALALALAAVAVGGLVQSATGFGFALIVAPALTATLGPFEAVPTATALGIVVNGLTLAGEGRRPAVLWRTAWWLLAASVPGTVVGALFLDWAPGDAVRVLVAVVVVATVVMYATTSAGDVGGRGASPVGPGVLAGALGATSAINGPPLVLHLRRIGAGAAASRDTLAFFFLVSGAITLVALAVVGALRLAPELLGLLVCAGIGQGLGRLAFPRLAAHREAATLGVLALSAAAATVPVVQAIG